VKWVLKAANIVDEKVDVLVCSANVSLNLSGGVGAELLGRFGLSMQQTLHQLLKARSPHCAERGEIIPYTSPLIPYKAILHAVAVNGWYESSSEIVTTLVRACLAKSQTYSARSIALTALATGYGNLSLESFAQGIRPLISEEFPPIEEARICLLEDYRVRELAQYLPEAVV
jgi:O-acetyl-ADP-ribose deacetylase (regulator of RNase III)